MEDTAERLGTSVRFARRLIAERRIAYVKLGRHVRIAERDLINFVAPAESRLAAGWVHDEPPPVRERAPTAVWPLAGALPDERRPPAHGPETFATKTDANRHLAQVEADLSRGQWSDPRLGRTTFAAWAARWEATTVNLRANTQAAYRILLRRYLLPTFGSMPWPPWTG